MAEPPAARSVRLVADWPDGTDSHRVASGRRIYGPEKEALGVLAIEIELERPDTD